MKSRLVDKNGLIFQQRSDQATAKRPRLAMEDIAHVLVPEDRENRFLPENPDQIYRKRSNFELYTQMLQDYQIRTLIEIKKNIILGDGWDIEPPIDEEGNEVEGTEEITNFVFDSLKKSYEGTFFDDLYRILDAMSYGFSLSEILWKVMDNHLVIKRLKNIPPDGIKFHVDRFGNFQEIGIVQRQVGANAALPIEKFIYYPWNQTHGNPYGESDLRSAYRPWFIKKEIITFHAMYLERFGMPYVLARYGPDMRDRAQDLQKVVENMQAATQAVLPEEVEIELKEISQRGAESYNAAIDLLDRQISSGLGVPDLLGFSGRTKGGSFALGKEQSKIFFSTIQRHRRVLEEIINEQLIKKLVKANFVTIPAIPRFVIKELIKEDNLNKIETAINLIKTQTFTPAPEHITHALEELGFPPGEIEIKEPPPPKGAFASHHHDDLIAASQKDDAYFTKQEKQAFKALAQSGMLLVENTINFQQIEDLFQTQIDKTTGKVSDILTKERDRITQLLLEKRPIENNKLQQIATFTISKEVTGKMRNVFNKSYNATGTEGVKASRSEIEAQVPAEFNIISEPELDLSGAKEFLKQFAKTKAFENAGDISNQLSRTIRIALTEGIRNGLTTKDVITDVRTAFDPFVEGGVVPSGEVDPFRLETIVRTNTTTFFNQSKLAVFNDAAKKDIVTHMQYTAILDARTSDICNELHGTVVPVGSADLSTITPPRHFNCRSLLLPITKFRTEEMQTGLRRGSLKEDLAKPKEFYNGFKTKTRPKQA